MVSSPPEAQAASRGRTLGSSRTLPARASVGGEERRAEQWRFGSDLAWDGWDGLHLVGFGACSWLLFKQLHSSQHEFFIDN